jgi:hypothetical protein
MSYPNDFRMDGMLIFKVYIVLCSFYFLYTALSLAYIVYRLFRIVINSLK